jgi:hypothetical protein
MNNQPLAINHELSAMSPSEILQNSADIVPCVVFAFNRPDNLQRILEALRPQKIDRLIVFVDGPRNDREVDLVASCRAVAKGVDWVAKELILKEDNRGLAGLSDNVGRVMESYKSAVFVEDDCLPMPAFYGFMRRALSHYEPEKRVFSIGGYQPITEAYFGDYPYSVVSFARFWCWGWSTWQDRWKAIAPLLPRYLELFGGWKKVPKTGGRELPLMVRACEEGTEKSWDINVAISMLWLQQVQLMPTRGLVRNLGLEGGSHDSGTPWLRSAFNRNVYGDQLGDLVWLPDVTVDKGYAKEYDKFASQVFSSTLLQRMKTVVWLTAHRRFRELAQSGMRLGVQSVRRQFGRKGSG